MDIVKADVAIVGAGGTGLRAAIAVAEQDPTLNIALISKVYPMRSHTVAAEGGAAGVIGEDDSLEKHFEDTVAGAGLWNRRSDHLELPWVCDRSYYSLCSGMQQKEPETGTVGGAQGSRGKALQKA